MPEPGCEDTQSARHRGPRRRPTAPARDRWRRAARGGLFCATALVLGTMLSRLLFHRDFGGPGLASFVAEVVSGSLAIVCLSLAAILAAPVVARTRRRLGGRRPG